MDEEEEEFEDEEEDESIEDDDDEDADDEDEDEEEHNGNAPPGVSPSTTPTVYRICIFYRLSCKCNNIRLLKKNTTLQMNKNLLLQPPVLYFDAKYYPILSYPIVYKIGYAVFKMP